MIDSVSIRISSGNGGDGAVSGRREKYIPQGGPDGGDGGDGGCVRFVCSASVNSLMPYRYNRRFAAGHGGNGMGRRRHGRRGEDVDIPVSEGTVVTMDSGDAGRGPVDMSRLGHVFVVPGGRGGRGNARFATPTNRFPLLAEQGEPGLSMEARLELKLIADVGIIGRPNAGKSSLLAALTAARPRIADYPFSTLEPALGVAESDGREVVLVDIPGLIEGAHKGLGLGHEFLRHIERTRALIHVLDGDVDDPAAEYEEVRAELTMYDERLPKKPEVVVLNKADIPGVSEKLSGIRRRLDSTTVHLISAAARTGLGQMLKDIQATLDEIADALSHEVADTGRGEPEVLSPRAVDSVKVDRTGRAYVVQAGRAGRVAAMVDPSNWEAKSQLYGYLERVGVVDALVKAGMGPGGRFTLGGKEWNWE